MLLLFVGYYADVHFFAHAHIINGVTIVHSHVHNQHHHDTNEGGHTTSELTLIANMASQLLTTAEVAPEAPAAFDILILTLGIEQDAKTVSEHLSCCSLRAPPALIG